MARKKISTDETNADVVAALEADEEFVVDTTTTKRLRREKRKEPDVTPEPDAIDIEIDAEPVQQFSPTSLAAMIYAEDEEPNLADEFCTIAVRRTPDAMGDSFATPCSTVTNLPRLPNVEVLADRSDVEDRVRLEYGGGHYFFQLRTATGLGRSWKATLSDLPKHLRQTTPEPDAGTPIPPAAPQPAVSPMDAFLDAMRKQKELSELLYGDDKRRMERELAEMREALAKRATNAEPQSDLAMAVNLLKDTNDPTIVDFVRDAILPADEPEAKTGFWDFAKYLLANKDEVAGLVGTVLSSLMPQTGPPNANVLAALRSQPPTAALPPPDPPPSSFQRRSKKQAERTDEKTEPEKKNDE